MLTMAYRTNQRDRHDTDYYRGYHRQNYNRVDKFRDIDDEMYSRKHDRFDNDYRRHRRYDNPNGTYGRFRENYRHGDRNYDFRRSYDHGDRYVDENMYARSYVRGTTVHKNDRYEVQVDRNSLSDSKVSKAVGGNYNVLGIMKVEGDYWERLNQEMLDQDLENSRMQSRKEKLERERKEKIEEEERLRKKKVEDEKCEEILRKQWIAEKCVFYLGVGTTLNLKGSSLQKFMESNLSREREDEERLRKLKSRFDESEERLRRWKIECEERLNRQKLEEEEKQTIQRIEKEEEEEEEERQRTIKLKEEERQRKLQLEEERQKKLKFAEEERRREQEKELSELKMKIQQFEQSMGIRNIYSDCSTNAERFDSVGTSCEPLNLAEKEDSDVLSLRTKDIVLTCKEEASRTNDEVGLTAKGTVHNGETEIDTPVIVSSHDEHDETCSLIQTVVVSQVSDDTEQSRHMVENIVVSNNSEFKKDNKATPEFEMTLEVSHNENRMDESYEVNRNENDVAQKHIGVLISTRETIEELLSTDCHIEDRDNEASTDTAESTMTNDFVLGDTCLGDMFVSHNETLSDKTDVGSTQQDLLVEQSTVQHKTEVDRMHKWAHKSTRHVASLRCGRRRSHKARYKQFKKRRKISKHGRKLTKIKKMWISQVHNVVKHDQRYRKEYWSTCHSLSSYGSSIRNRRLLYADIIPTRMKEHLMTRRSCSANRRKIKF